MSEENDIAQLRSQVDNLRALCALQSAEIGALFVLLSRLHHTLHAHEEPPPEIGDAYLRLRKELTYKQLTAIEDKNSALAAEIQRILDNTCRIYPLSDFKEPDTEPTG